MKKSNIVWIVLGVLIVGLSICLYLSEQDRKEQKALIKEYRNSAEKPLTEQIPKIIYVSKDSATHIRQEIVKSKEMENTINKDFQHYVKDTLAVALDVAVEKINELTKVKAKLEGELKATKIELAENKSKRIFYENQYLSIVSHIDSLGQPQHLRYTYNADLNIAQFSKRKNFFSKKKEYIDVSSPDPNFKVNGIEVFRKEINTPSQDIGLGLQVGYGFSRTLGFSPYLGVGVSYNLFKL